MLATVTGLTMAVLTVGIQSAHAATPSGSSGPGCPSAVTITALTIEKQLVNGQVVVDISHDGQGCPDATPATLHIHENLTTSPTASSDTGHQSNADIAVGGNFGNSASFDLLTAVPGKCFVQFDASAGTIRRGRFFATATCPVATQPSVAASSSLVSSGTPTSSSPSVSSGGTPTSSSPSVSGGGTPTSRSSTPVHLPTSHSVANMSTSRTPPQHPKRQLAMTGTQTAELIGVAALLLCGGALLYWTARPRRQH